MKTLLPFYCILLSALFVVQAQAKTQTSPATSISTPTSVSVATSVNDDQVIQLTYSSAVRLDQVLNDGLNNIKTLPSQRVHTSPQPVFWTGAALYDQKQTKQMQQQKQQLLSRLDRLAQEWQDDAEQVSTVNALKGSLTKLMLAHRIMQPLDPDLVRMQPSLSPLLSGDFQLILPARPTSVLVLGAVRRSKNILWQERANAAFYLDQAKPTSDAENSDVWVIQPDGVAEQHQIAYWNHKHQDIAPGAIIYMGFDSLPSDFTTLNQDIINLLRNRAL
ncbi:capsule biosynthesis GfcC family protein [Photobacterium sagamiensis]|uniref:capsule biosynthesis GfcC family protein n=1 Tax=Photobacterium sagamiensis TaxID=2910241 RepID=UPI003D0D4BD1